MPSFKHWFLPNTFFLVLGLGLNCTIGYGTLFYSFSLISIELETDFGWSREYIFGVYSLGILLSGFAAPFFGKWLDHYKARWPMVIGSGICALLLYCLSLINSKFSYFTVMLLLEAVSILVLYESAFVALTQATGKKARLPITQITLMAGFASTIFWPFVAWVIEWGDWRIAYQIMAALHLLVCLPIHWLILKPTTQLKDEIAPTNQQIQKDIPHDYKTEFIIAFCLGFAAFSISSLQIHIFRIFSDLGITHQLALIAGMIIGPFQVVSRFLDILLGKHISPLQLGVVCFGFMSIGIICLLPGTWFNGGNILLFGALFGAGQGLNYIVRGAIPLILFNHNQYGAITGRMSSVRMVMTAIAPFSFSVLMDSIGTVLSLTLLAIILALCATGIYFLQHRNQ